MKLVKLLLCTVLLALTGCIAKPKAESPKIAIAFLADVHLQDIFGTFQDVNYKGIKNPKTGTYVNIRTMGAQLQSTRIFNENYFAFLTALEDIAKRGIKQVVLPGDFSDNGQPIHLRGLKRILNTYAEKHGMAFYLTTGNHDPVRPFIKDGTTYDFLGAGGKAQIITSVNRDFKPVYKDELQPIVTADIKEWGYKEILNELSDFGFFPKADYLYWETPFSRYTYNDYSWEKAQQSAALEKRTYPILNTNVVLPDASYLVEPVEGLWLLAIDANAYVPKATLSGVPENPSDFSGASVGYNNVLIYKKHLITWVKKVVQAAKTHGKTLIAFSHYPMIDFNDDASEELKTLFGANKMQLHRVPNEDVAKVFADAGITIHFGGHMHSNDTGVRTTKKGNTLFNIQTPSIAGYKAAYKILEIQSDATFEIKTVVIDAVKDFNSLFPLYELEYAYLDKTKRGKLWNKAVLQAKDYQDFMQWHLEELVRLRFIPKDWPKPLTELLIHKTGKELLLNHSPEHINTIKTELKANDLVLEAFESWTGFDMIVDFYKIRNADELAYRDIEPGRLKQYDILCTHLAETQDENLRLWAKIFQKTKRGKPADHFKINLKKQTIERIKSYFGVID